MRQVRFIAAVLSDRARLMWDVKLLGVHLRQKAGAEFGEDAANLMALHSAASRGQCVGIAIGCKQGQLISSCYGMIERE